MVMFLIRFTEYDILNWQSALEIPAERSFARVVCEPIYD